MSSSSDSHADLESLLAALRERSICPDLLADLESRLARAAELETNFANAVEQAKLSALKQFAYGASHEINNPLANISTRAQALLVEEQHPERRKKLATIVAQAMRAHEMISDLMLFARPPELVLSDVALKTLVETIVRECQTDARAQSTEILQQVQPPDLVVRADATQLGVALKALIRNALEALGKGGRIEVEALVDEAHDETHVILSVSDDGPGIEPHVRPHIFDPFYSGREAGRGLGFGLPKCWRIAELHGGRIEVESEPGEGTVFRLVLPL
jgi:signal transduction histidine kinase